MRPLRTAAKALLSATFVTGGAKALANPEALVPAAKPVTDRLAPLLDRAEALLPDAVKARGVHMPTQARTLVKVNGGVQLVCGLLMFTRLSRPAAAVLAGTLIPTTVAGHPFWAYADPAERREQRLQFMKNFSILGGLLLAAVDTQGRPGLRWRANRMVTDTRRRMARVAHTAHREARIAIRSANAGRHLPG
jgi:putative oxidoreductase